MSRDPLHYVWIDLETTGLVARRDFIFEVALAVAPVPFPLRNGPIYTYVTHFARRRDVKIDPFVQDMHDRNGLWAAAAASTLDIGALEDSLLWHLPEETYCLAGSSAYFDLGFLREELPRVAAKFHHRILDVSAVKLVCESLGMPRIPKAEAHRAGADIAESMSHLGRCRDWLAEGDGLIVTADGLALSGADGWRW
jgi:oligoribonuclease